MNTVNNIVICICCAAVIGSVVYMLTPTGSFKKSIKSITGLFILACILLPWFNADKDTSEIIPSFEYSEKPHTTLNKTIQKQIINAAEQSVHAYLIKNDVVIIEINTQLYQEGDNYGIQKMTVNTEKQDNVSEIEKNATEYFGFEIDLIPGE